MVIALKPCAELTAEQRYCQAFNILQYLKTKMLVPERLIHRGSGAGMIFQLHPGQLYSINTLHLALQL
jgi:hypothetical protein